MEHDLGHPTNNGVKVAKEVAYIYMHALTKMIGDSENKDTITDTRQASDFLSDLFPENRGLDLRKERKDLFTKEMIQLKLPERIDQIEIKELLDLRNDKGFLTKKAAFHNTLNLYLDNTDIHYKSAYLDSLVELESEIKKWIAPSFGIVSTGVQIFCQTTMPSYIPPILGSLIPSFIPQSESSELNRDKKNSLQFLTDISSITHN
ncbi:hypothetical protein [Planococcus maritimus]|uniref:hypothetical protein n=1 Tax=Planococcus maritimus TaxID=192421 RepID=UPI0007973D91|nr:hypothetical protein [Planococcus maritimus]KYG58486.1 hypothetical protein AY633_09455 [Planococcus maritimus]